MSTTRHPGYSAANIARARELDDGLPLDVCPGCGQDVTGWRDHERHVMPGVVIARPTLPYPFTGDKGVGLCQICPWERDYLVARAFRRHVATVGSREAVA